MKTLRIIITGTLIAILSGCVPSLNPLFTDKDLIFDTTLLGDWKNKEEKWSFEKNGDNKYKLTHLDNGNQATFSAHLVKINDFTFLDISPLDLKSKNYLYEAHLFPVHTFSKIEIEKEQIVIRMLDPDMLEKAINDKKVEIAHVKSQDDRILLTASTKDLQIFVQSELELFGEPLTLKKEE